MCMGIKECVCVWVWVWSGRKDHDGRWDAVWDEHGRGKRESCGEEKVARWRWRRTHEGRKDTRGKGRCTVSFSVKSGAFERHKCTDREYVFCSRICALCVCVCRMTCW